ncbi:response regulator [Ideonella livida]|uniref:Response regulator transcription factor n=1 Tax=Ideonella livida TaxID=2707176 RepID=A0A7C9PJF0_9BURK|nr:response regulator transcription factor [Ideonella livida]NDY92672.1 response regulator transcription factor [Ideonella livida]
MLQILLLDDHAVVRAGYRQFIDSQGDMRVAAEAGTSAQACELLRTTAVDIAVVDLDLKGDSGLEALRRLRERRAGLRQLVFTMHDHPGYALQALRAGAQGYLTKDSDPQDMVDALRALGQGRTVFPAGLAATLAGAPEGEGQRLAQLSPREFDIFRLATAGQDIGEIAKALHLSEKTVFNYMSLVRQKLEVRSDFKLMRLAAEQGLVRW